MPLKTVTRGLSYSQTMIILIGKAPLYRYLLWQVHACSDYNGCFYVLYARLYFENVWWCAFCEKLFRMQIRMQLCMCTHNCIISQEYMNGTIVPLRAWDARLYVPLHMHSGGLWYVLGSVVCLSVSNPCAPSTVVNLSEILLSNTETNLLSKGIPSAPCHHNCRPSSWRMTWNAISGYSDYMSSS